MYAQFREQLSRIATELLPDASEEWLNRFFSFQRETSVYLSTGHLGIGVQHNNTREKRNSMQSRRS